MNLNNANRMVNSIDPHQTASLGAFLSRSSLFAQTCLTEYCKVLANSADPDLLEEQSDQGLHCLQFRLHLLYALFYSKAVLFKF